MGEDKKPEWSDPNNPESFNSSIMKGVELACRPQPSVQKPFCEKTRGTDFEEILIRYSQRRSSKLAQAITLIESNADHHFELAQELLQKFYRTQGNRSE